MIPAKTGENQAVSTDESAVNALKCGLDDIAEIREGRQDVALGSGQAALFSV